MVGIMPAVKRWGEHGTVRRYRQGGCNELRGGKQGDGERCDKCKTAQREFNQGIRAGQVIPPNSNANVLRIDKRRHTSPQNLGRHLSSRASDPEQPKIPGRPKMGRNEAAIWKQLEPFQDDHPARVEMALTAAKILDDPDRVSLHTQALRQLDQILERVTGGRKSKSKGRLAAVQAMTARAR
jgi:hypothetical protein